MSGSFASHLVWSGRHDDAEPDACRGDRHRLLRAVIRDAENPENLGHLLENLFRRRPSRRPLLAGCKESFKKNRSAQGCWTFTSMFVNAKKKVNDEWWIFRHRKDSKKTELMSEVVDRNESNHLESMGSTYLHPWMTDFFSLNKKVKKHDSETGLGSFLTITKLMGKKKRERDERNIQFRGNKRKGLNWRMGISATGLIGLNQGQTRTDETDR